MLNWEQDIGVWDAVLLEPLTEDAFLSNLHQRFKRDQIYTYIGNVLISVNPYKKLALYSADLAANYARRAPFQLPPHIYGITNTAYRWLQDRNEDQCIIITGESGSGKTEAARIVLQFLVLTSGNVSKEVKLCNDQLVQANTVLEAFGNARTVKNKNASRFGKFLDIQFNFRGEPIGGFLTNSYLSTRSGDFIHNIGEHDVLVVGFQAQLFPLDVLIQSHVISEEWVRNAPTIGRFSIFKNQTRRYFLSHNLIRLNLSLKSLTSRVTNLSFGDRNFHIFYQLLSGADIQLLKCLKLQRNVEQYEILQSHDDHVPTQTDEKDKQLFVYTKNALEILNFAPEEVLNIFQVIAVILKLGNLKFVPCNNIDGTEGCCIANDYELYDVCEILNVEFKWLQRSLTSRYLDEGILAELNSFEASKTNDSLCRILYSRLFTWLVNKINDKLKVSRQTRCNKRKVLGVLDFYGFETFENNGLEQLLINYCNEKLQQAILMCTLKEEQEEIVKEGLEWTRIEYFSNGSICQLLEHETHGILSLLEEPTSHSDQGYLTRIEQCCAGHSHCLIGDPIIPKSSFQIKHFAGPVTYTIRNFIERNRNDLSKELYRAMYRCNNSLVQELFPEGNPKRCTLKRTLSATNHLKITLNSLLKSLLPRHSHYIRCIKPNEVKQAKIFEISLVQHQVRYLCLLPTVELWRTGYCYRLLYSHFLHRYKMLNSSTWPKFYGPSIEGVSTILKSLPLPGAEFIFGRTKVFVRSPRTVFELEEFRRERLHYLAALIQKCYRGYRQRRKFQKMRRSQRVIAAAWRTWRAREEFRTLKHRREIEWAATVIQRHYIQWKRKQFLLTLANFLKNKDLESPTCTNWPTTNKSKFQECNVLLRRLYHKWRCHKYRLKFDQTSRNRMREKVTASLIFKDRKSSYSRSVSHPFLGDYVRLRQNIQWKKLCLETNDQYVVFADIVNKIARSSGKIKYRVPATEIYRISLSPFLDDVAVVHIKAGDMSRKKGDFVLQTGHVIEIVTKLFLVVQNALGKAPEVNITTEFEANFGSQTVTFTFKCVGLPEVQHGQIRVMRKGARMEVLV